MSRCRLHDCRIGAGDCNDGLLVVGHDQGRTGREAQEAVREFHLVWEAILERKRDQLSSLAATSRRNMPGARPTLPRTVFQRDAVQADVERGLVIGLIEPALRGLADLTAGE